MITTSAPTHHIPQAMEHEPLPLTVADRASRFLPLDGVRALAAGWVLVAHTSTMYIPIIRGHFLWPTNVVWYGHEAVDVFIVLSGFCLMLAAKGRAIRGPDARRFFLRRSLRIVPPYMAALVFALALHYVIQSRGNGHGAVLTGELVLVNALLIQDWVPRLNTLNPAFWSVALEWKIYFLFPALTIILFRFGARAALISSVLATVAYSAIILLARPDGSWAGTTPWYLFCFTLGAVAAWDVQRGKASIRAWSIYGFVGLMVAAVTLFLWPQDGQGDAAFEHWLPLSDCAVALATAAALVLISCPPDRVNRAVLFTRKLLSLRALVWFGEISYSVYLTHIPILWVVRAALQRGPQVNSPVLQSLILLAVGGPLCVLAAYAFFVAFERPFMRIGRRVSVVAEQPQLAVSA